MDATAPLSRSSSRPRPSSRPTTPLRPSSRSSFREGHGYGASVSNTGYTDPAINALEPQFAELADSMADLEANFMHLQLMHESLTRFSESFASFLYGLNMNAFCVDFPEAPIPESFRRAKQAEVERELETEQNRPIHEDEATFIRPLFLRVEPEEDRVRVVPLAVVILREGPIEAVQAPCLGEEEYGERMRWIEI
ncbi:hypothetical protein EYZ11_009078 [Aspergillus tanneri]|uniref:DASH complex subunit DAM1 n=1 Tax=Aspergillus tanneri TaxID=1220188 RepID=A0A4S3J900_9EURO|nr:hypothetical protein EYZ11_009078 [Aspergillus tanneri]